MINKLKHLYRITHALFREHVVKQHTRSDKWPETRKHFLISNPTCAACGTSKKLQVHHIEPFHLDPTKELDETNLITMCMSTNECHLLLAHGDNYRYYNPTIREDAAEVLANPEKMDELRKKAKSTRKFL